MVVHEHGAEATEQATCNLFTADLGSEICKNKPKTYGREFPLSFSHHMVRNICMVIALLGSPVREVLLKIWHQRYQLFINLSSNAKNGLNNIYQNKTGRPSADCCLLAHHKYDYQIKCHPGCYIFNTPSCHPITPPLFTKPEPASSSLKHWNKPTSILFCGLSPPHFNSNHTPHISSCPAASGLSLTIGPLLSVLSTASP